MLKKVPHVAPSTAESMTFLQKCQIKEVMLLLLQKLFETGTFAFRKTSDFFVIKAIFRVFFLFFRDSHHTFLPGSSVCFGPSHCCRFLTKSRNAPKMVLTKKSKAFIKAKSMASKSI